MSKTDNQTKADYVPYGEEWVKEMKKLPKDFLIGMIKDLNLKRKEAKLIPSPAHTEVTDTRVWVEKRIEKDGNPDMAGRYISINKDGECRDMWFNRISHKWYWPSNAEAGPQHIVSYLLPVQSLESKIADYLDKYRKDIGSTNYRMAKGILKLINSLKQI